MTSRSIVLQEALCPQAHTCYQDLPPRGRLERLYCSFSAFFATLARLDLHLPAMYR